MPPGLGHIPQPHGVRPHARATWTPLAARLWKLPQNTFRLPLPSPSPRSPAPTGRCQLTRGTGSARHRPPPLSPCRRPRSHHHAGPRDAPSRQWAPTGAPRGTGTQGGKQGAASHRGGWKRGASQIRGCLGSLGAGVTWGLQEPRCSPLPRSHHGSARWTKRAAKIKSPFIFKAVNLPSCRLAKGTLTAKWEFPDALLGHVPKAPVHHPAPQLGVLLCWEEALRERPARLPSPFRGEKSGGRNLGAPPFPDRRVRGGGGAGGGEERGVVLPAMKSLLWARRGGAGRETSPGEVPSPSKQTATAEQTATTEQTTTAEQTTTIEQTTTTEQTAATGPAPLGSRPPRFPLATRAAVWLSLACRVTASSARFSLPPGLPLSRRRARGWAPLPCAWVLGGQRPTKLSTACCPPAVSSPLPGGCSAAELGRSASRGKREAQPN